MLDRIDELIARGVIGGTERNAADYQIATSLSLLLTMDDLRPMIDGRPAGRLAREVVTHQPGHLSARCLPSDARSPPFRRTLGVRSSVHMEAATPLRQPHVRLLGDVVAIDGLVIDDEAAVRVVREREQNGADPAKTVRDAVEIGTRVLDREQAGANAEFVKTEFEKAATDLNSQFTTRAREVAEYFNERVEQVFGPENGHLSRELEKLFSDGSTASVQNRVRELVQETMTRSREDLMKQFSSADGANPLADFKAGTDSRPQGG